MLHDIITQMVYFWLTKRNLAAFEIMHVHVCDTASLYKIHSVRKFANTGVRNFYAYENVCDYSICQGQVYCEYTHHVHRVKINV